MRYFIIFFSLLFPFLLSAQEHRVPIDTEGNLFILSVQNSTQNVLTDVRVTVASAPDWVVFRSSVVAVESIPANQSRDVQFEFRVPEGQPGRVDSVRFVISDAGGRFWGQRLLQFRSVVLPKTTRLAPPFPNPANPGTTIRYVLHAPSHIQLEIFNILGQRVRRLLDEGKPAGEFNIDWDGRNDHGIAMATGVYVVQLTATENGTKKVRHFNTKIIVQK